MEGRVVAVMSTDWCLIEFEDGATGKLWTMKIQSEEGQLPFEIGTKVRLEKVESE